MKDPRKRAYRESAKDRPRCKRCGHLVWETGDRAGQCWYCNRVNRKVQQAYRSEK